MMAVANSIANFFVGLFLQAVYKPDNQHSVYADCSKEPLRVIPTAKWNKGVCHKHAQILSRAFRLAGLVDEKEKDRFEMIQRYSLGHNPDPGISFELELKNEPHSQKCILHVCTEGEDCWPYVIIKKGESAEAVHKTLLQSIMGGKEKIILA